MSLFSFIHVFVPNLFLCLCQILSLFFGHFIHNIYIYLVSTFPKEDDFVSFNCHRIQCALAGIGSL